MTRMIKSFLTFIHQLLSALRGEIQVKEVFHNNRLIGSLLVSSFHGYDIEVFCQKRQYMRKHLKSRLRGKIHTVFDVYCELDGYPPDVLYKACQTRITFPALLPLYMDDKYHVTALVNAYLDMIQKLLISDSRNN